LRWMREAFGESFVDMDFESAGKTVTLRYYAAGDEVPRPIHTASNGMVCMLFNLVALVCPDTSEGLNNASLVCIDEPETGLHPHALRTFITAAREWSAEKGTTVILATHSPFLLNEFSQTPEQVFVMDPSGEKQLWRLDEELNAEWLKQFMLGDLYGRDFARQGEDA
jgi:predicted ATPase